MNTEWKPIASAPKDGTPVLLFARHIYAESRTRVVGAYLLDHGWLAQSYVGQGSARLDPSHWMALPPFPDCSPPAPTSHPIPTGATGEDERQPDLCPRCDGSGEITVMSDSSPDAHDVNVCCDHCQGSGAAVDAAKYLAAALSGEKYRHMQLWAEYRNFHRSLCARFGYGHDPVHFRRDLVSLEEAIAAKVSAPAAGDALDAIALPISAARMIRREYLPSNPKRMSHAAVRDAVEQFLGALEAAEAAIAQQSQRKEA